MHTEMQILEQVIIFVFKPIIPPKIQTFMTQQSTLYSQADGFNWFWVVSVHFWWIPVSNKPEQAPLQHNHLKQKSNLSEWTL